MAPVAWTILRCVAWAWAALWAYPFTRAALQVLQSPGLRSGSVLCRLSALVAVAVAILLLVYSTPEKIQDSSILKVPGVWLIGAAFLLIQLSDWLHLRADRLE